MLGRLAADIARLGAGSPWSDTEVPHLTLVALDEHSGPLDMLYEPMVCFIADGAKRAVAGKRSWVVERGQMFLNVPVLPVTATFERVPYRSAVLQLGGRTLADLLLEVDGTSRQSSWESGGQASAPMTPDLVEAVARWVRLLDTPDDIGPLASPVEREILYRLLGSPIGPLLRQSALAGSALTRVRETTAWIAAHFAEPLRVDQLAAMAHMSAATLHRHFKAATGMSPLRFQKHLRLQEARRLLIAGDTPVARVAESVGYRSATQFNREYRRAYGLPPYKDASRLRDRLTNAETTTRVPVG